MTNKKINRIIHAVNEIVEGEIDKFPEGQAYLEKLNNHTLNSLDLLIFASKCYDAGIAATEENVENQESDSQATNKLTLFDDDYPLVNFDYENDEPEESNVDGQSFDDESETLSDQLGK